MTFIEPNPVAPSGNASRRRSHAIAAIGVGLMFGIALLRELLAPGARVPLGAQFLDLPSLVPRLWRPLLLLLSLLSELIALSAVARALERAKAPPSRAACTTALVGIAVMLLFMLAVWVCQGAPAHSLGRILWGAPLSGLEVFGLWILAFRFPQLVDDARLRDLEIVRVRQEAELLHLREHLQPHFLRNSLNTIAALLSEDPREARNLLATLGDLLSDSIASSAALRTLGEELDWLKRYAEILEARHRGALSFTWEEEPAARATLVPRLLLQPLVENAVSHGALARAGDGRVVVRALARPGGGTRIEVEDNGPGFAASEPPQEGLGLRLVRRRVELEARGAFRLEPLPGGAKATVELP